MPIVAPTLVGPDGKDEAIYFSQLFVRSDSRYETFEDLRGSTLAYNDATSLSGYYCLKFFLLAYNNEFNSSIPKPFFSGIIQTGAHANSLAAVLDGSADVLSLDLNVLAALQQHPSGREKLALLRPIPVPSLTYPISTPTLDTYTVSRNGLLGPNPAQPLVISRRLGPHLIDAITCALVSLPPSVLSNIRSHRYVRVDHSNYEGIAAMINMCEGVDLLTPNEEHI